MILSDKDIKAKLHSREIIITSPNDDHEENIKAASIDLRLGKHFRVFKHREISIIDTKNKKSLEASTDLITIEEEQGVILQAGEILSGVSVERIKLGEHIIGKVVNRSSYDRIGIQINSGGIIQPGFEGTITINLKNENKIPVKIYPGEKICQVVFEDLSSNAETPYYQDPKSKYQGQELPQRSLLDKEIEV